MHITLHARTNTSRRGRCDSGCEMGFGKPEILVQYGVIYISEANPLSISSAKEDYHTFPSPEWNFLFRFPFPDSHWTPNRDKVTIPSRVPSFQISIMAIGR